MSDSKGRVEINAVVMCGGSGTRFWPASRRAKPKQFLRLGGESSLLQQTVERLDPLIPPERVFLLAAEEHRDALREHLPQVPESNLILEPAARNTAPALALAARVLEEVSPEAVMAALPADHAIADPVGFRNCLETAARAADEKGVIATIGIEPDAPETGYGYIEIAGGRGDGTREVKRFVEKPDLETAQKYLAGGRHLWNAGIFLMRADTLRDELRRQRHDIWAPVWEGLPDPGEEGFAEMLDRIYPGLPKVSIDYAVMEGAEKVVCVPGGFGWNDLGSWSALEKLWGLDGEGNAASGRYYSIDSRGNIVSVGGKQVALIGVEDLVVVEREDVVLVCRKDRCQDVREMIEKLRSEGREDLL